MGGRSSGLSFRAMLEKKKKKGKEIDKEKGGKDYIT
jgi:hypothetical protein